MLSADVALNSEKMFHWSVCQQNTLNTDYQPTTTWLNSAKTVGIFLVLSCYIAKSQRSDVYDISVGLKVSVNATSSTVQQSPSV